MKPPLRVRLKVEEKALDVAAFFASNGYDVGSCRGDMIYANSPPDHRLICVALVDDKAIDDMVAKMRVAFHGRPDLFGLTSRVIILEGELDTRLVVFLDIAALEA